MRGFALLCRRDLVQRIPLFIASFAMGLFILGVPFLPGSRLSPAELRGAAGLVAALTWSAVLALLLGGSIFTRDLTENRLAFDFRLPVRPIAIWAARLFAACATIALAAGLVLAPSALAGMDLAGAAAGLEVLIGVDPRGVGAPSRSALAFAPIAVLALLLLANPAALAARARQSWAGVDVVSVGVISVAATWSWQLLGLWEASYALWRTGALLVTLTLLGAVVASCLQVHRGRTETDRAQKSLSIALIVSALATASAVLAYANWYVRPQVSALVGNYAYAASLGPNWVSLMGGTTRDKDFWARFLLHPSSGKSIRLGPTEQYMDSGEVKGARDGSRAAWLEWDGSRAHSSLRLQVLDLASPQATPSETGITWRPPVREWALSPRGDAVASLQDSGGENSPRRLVVENVDSAAIESSVLLPGCEHDGPLLFLNRTELLAACGEIYNDVYPERWYGVLHVDLNSRVVRPFDSRFYPDRLFAWRLNRNAPRPWDFAEQSSAFEGPPAIDAVSRDRNRRWQWFDPESKSLKPLLQEGQYQTGLRSLY